MGGSEMPKGLRNLIALLSYEDKLRKFRYIHIRDPASEDELDEFIVPLARGLYNEDWDEWSPDDIELE